MNTCAQRHEPDAVLRAETGKAGRRRFLQAGIAAGAGAALAGGSPRVSMAAEPGVAAGCNESVQDIINAALVAENLAMTFYYTGLTTKTVLGSRSARRASPGGDAGVACLEAALGQELRHAQFLADFGAISPYKHFYFPASTFKRLGYTSHYGLFLWVLDRLETAFVGAYLAAVQRFGALGHMDLAVLATRILAVECEHRAIGRVVAGDYPVDNVTLEVNSFRCVGDAVTFLKPFLTGHGFRGGVTGPIRIPTQGDIIKLVGKNLSS